MRFLILYSIFFVLVSCGSFSHLKIIGWQESVSLPELKISNLKVKVDSGAKTSSLHVKILKKYQKRGRSYVRFQTFSKSKVHELPVLEYRKVRSSNGRVELRPVISTIIKLKGDQWPIEITLTDRSKMKFPMLLGREGIKNRFLIDVGQKGALYE